MFSTISSRWQLTKDQETPIDGNHVYSEWSWRGRWDRLLTNRGWPCDKMYLPSKQVLVKGKRVSIEQCVSKWLCEELTWPRKLDHLRASLKSSLWGGLLLSDLNGLHFCLKVLHKGSVWWLRWLLIYCHISAIGIVYSPINSVVKEDRVMDNFSSVTFWVTVAFY